MAENEDQQKPDRGTALCNRRVDGPYTVFPNAIVQSKDIRLTPNEFRVLTYIASLPEDWNLRPAQVAEVCAIGRDAVYNAIHGLQEKNLARHLIAREGGRIKRRRWEFTLTPGLFSEPENSLFLKTRIKRKKLVPEKPDQDSPDQVRPTLQRTDRTKPKKKKINSQTDGKIHELVVVTDVATGGGTASQVAAALPEIKMGSAREDLPALWPFPDKHSVSQRIKKTGIEPQAVWDQFLRQKLAGKVSGNIRNPGGYLVKMAQAMARDAYGPPDPDALAAFRQSRSPGWQPRQRQQGEPIDPAIYERILAEEDAERQAARPPKTFKPGGYRGQRALKRY